MNKPNNPLRQGLRLKRVPQSNTIIILGATGDLTHRKLLPSLFSLYKQGLLPSALQIIAFARRDKSDDDYRKDVTQSLKKYSDNPDNSSLENFTNKIVYHRGDFTHSEPYEKLKNRLDKIEQERESAPNRLFYLATPPSGYQDIINQLGKAGLSKNEKGWTRIIIEKPFGHDLDSAKRLNDVVLQVFQENQVYRIDHYLGKETVQNLLVFRFANGIFEPIWNRRYIDHVQITVAETLGVEGRGRFFEETGILRDIVQNHMMQLLCLVAMEPPPSFEPNAVRDEKVKVLHAVQKINKTDMDRILVRGQYAEGSLMGESVPAYLQEDGVSPESTTETFFASKIELNNWRWAGVPFFLRSGKRLPKKVTEIAITFKDAPLQIFGPDAEEKIMSNVLALNIQPDEGISLGFDSKVPGYASLIRPVTMEFRYGTSFGNPPPDAYERLLLDAMIGDPTLFTRADENEMAWKIIQPVLEYIQEHTRIKPEKYPAGTWGPEKSQQLIHAKNRRWRRL